MGEDGEEATGQKSVTLFFGSWWDCSDIGDQSTKEYIARLYNDVHASDVTELIISIHLTFF